MPAGLCSPAASKLSRLKVILLQQGIHVKPAGCLVQANMIRWLFQRGGLLPERDAVQNEWDARCMLEWYRHYARLEGGNAGQGSDWIHSPGSKPAGSVQSAKPLQCLSDVSAAREGIAFIPAEALPVRQLKIVQLPEDCTLLNFNLLPQYGQSVAKWDLQ